MRLPAGVTLRGSVYWCRVVIPKDLRPLYPRTASGALPTTHSNVSLQTSDRAEARVRGLARRAEVEAEFLLRRKAQSPSPIVPTAALVDMLAERIRHKILSDDDQRRLTGNPIQGYPLQVEGHPIPDDPLERLELLRTLEALHVKARGISVGLGSPGFGLELARAEARRLGISIDWTGQEAALLKLARVGIRAYADAAQRTDGVPIDTPAPPADPAIPQDSQANPEAPVYLRDALDNWKAKRHPRQDAVKRTERALLLLKESGQDKPLDKLTKPDGARLRDWLRAPERGFKQKTALNYWSALLTLWNIAVEYGQGGVTSNPWTGLDFDVTDSKTREEFTHEELRAIFGSTLYTQGAYRPIYSVQPWDAYFAMLLGLWTGSRIGEIAQLEVADVMTVNGIPCVSFHEEAEGSTIKETASIRKVPVAPELIRLGFLDYAEHTRAAGDLKLFPSLHRGGKVSPGDVMGEWVRGYRKDLGLPSGHLQGFHKFRHTIRSALAALHIGPETADAVTGHAAQGSTGRRVYTHIALATVLEALQRPLYPFLTLPRVYPTPSTQATA